MNWWIEVKQYQRYDDEDGEDHYLVEQEDEDDSNNQFVLQGATKSPFLIRILICKSNGITTEELKWRETNQWISSSSLLLGNRKRSIS